MPSDLRNNRYQHLFGINVGKYYGEIVADSNPNHVNSDKTH